MDNASHSRILEPIDPNSVSLISSSSGSNLYSGIQDETSHSPFRTPGSPSVVDSEGALTAKWQFDRKEFEFKSNSTPSRSIDPQHQKILHVRKRRSQLMGAKPRVPSKLHHSTSKLDLLDKEKLTSFPIPPPRGSQPSQNVKRLKLNPINEIRIHNTKEDRRISYGFPGKRGPLQEEEGDEDDSNEHPIVLVEDYIPIEEWSRGNAAGKRLSLSNLRSKMSKRSDMHLPVRLINTSRKECSKTPSSSVTLIPHILDDNFMHEDSVCSLQENGAQTLSLRDDEAVSSSFQHMIRSLIKNEEKEDSDEYLSGLRLNSSLKKCVVCEKPLYEISSILGEASHFKEIVCDKCTERYEEAAKIFEDYEFETSLDSSHDSSLNSLEGAVQLSHTENPEQQVTSFTAQQRTRFSNELIRRLQLQSSGVSTPQRKDNLDNGLLLWFMEAKKRITELLTKNRNAASGVSK
ncbi:hypothetical protein HG536_0G02330 [Torulaspora globosa]|uniref:Uncharacterized protein n=1 Tax=Torulaspora globosa TaxID=48254 RepID=A0A7G3ZLI6_9SACH|nr:uncharacterized protein HG536_0G02330 [Torulaspora globosa]QLL34372.1 hypothetical protein HG536_0G02330 [Torulaspora globosa]